MASPTVGRVVVIGSASASRCTNGLDDVVHGATGIGGKLYLTTESRRWV